MMIIEGKYNKAIIYGDIVDDNAKEQIKELCNQKSSIGRKIRIMPDVHAGKGCVIGFTADIGDIVIPSIVGVDIGCGMLTVSLGNIEIDFEKLDDIIHKYVPSGTSVHEGRLVRFPKLQNLKCYRNLRDTKRLERSIGTLGGGNHFIEIDKDDENNKYLVIHTGSRNLGHQVAEYYINMAYDIMSGKDKIFEEQKRIIEEYKATGRKSEIQKAIVELKKSYLAKEIDIPKELCYLYGEYKEMYINDMTICQEFANINRIKIADIILEKLFDKNINDFEHFETIHNYIDMKTNIVRKGAVSAQKGEKLLIPINMRDGSLICIGKGNSEWNYSAPHGAGRLFSRGVAKEKFNIEEFKNSMEGIYSTSINESTLDESPMAYKNADEIIKNIDITADIVKFIKPLYNYKA